MSQDCSGKTALVTGAATGIGRSCALALAAAGAKLIVTDIDVSGVEKTAKMITDAGGQARSLTQDVSQESVWLEIMESLQKTEGQLNILVNNAGIAIGGPVTEMSLEDWRRQNAINLDGVFWAANILFH